MNGWPASKIVVPIDFSELSLAAVDSALQIAGTSDRLYVLHVLPILADYEATLLWSNIGDDTRRRHSEQALRERLPEGKYTGLHLEVRFGDAGQEIASYAEEIGAELIVISSHGRTGLTRLLIGSTAERVVRLAHCPVLVLRSGTTKS